MQKVLRVMVWAWLSAFFSCSPSLFGAQNVVPSQNWKTLETAHFYIHYTPEYRAWAISASHELEASVAIIKQTQNRQLAEKADVVVFDPLNAVNGFAMSFSTKPIMALYTTPPQSHSMISNTSSWQQLLALHEYVHLVHLAQPSRNHWVQTLSEFWDVYDLALRQPTSRWVAEGYATLLESRLTGRGRLFDAQAEAWVRQLAREGAMPKYRELNQTQGKYRIGAMAYLVGGRFLHWLEQTYSQQKLDAVWTRMQAVKRRDFEAAFSGVFLASPEYLYQRFVAEYTFEALLQEREIGKSNSKLWFDGKYDLSYPRLSPSGDTLAIVATNNKGESEILVLPLSEDKKQKQRFIEAQEAILKADPDDIADALPEVFNPSATHKLAEINFAGMAHLTWRDSDHLWFTAFSRDKFGLRHQDLFQWQLSTGVVQQLTFGANLRSFDIHARANKVVAEQAQYGYSSLVAFDISQRGGKVKLVQKVQLSAQNDLAISYDLPRFNPSNSRQLAVLSKRLNQPWQLSILDLSNQVQLVVPMPKEHQFLSYPSWSRDGESLYFVAGHGSTLQLYQYSTHSGQLSQLSQGQEVLSWPIALPAQSEHEQDAILHLALRARGPDVFIKRIDPKQVVAVSERTEVDNFEYLTQAIANEAHKIAPAQINLDDTIGVEREYDVWQQDFTLTLMGTKSTAAYDGVEVGVKGGDVMQRMNWNGSAMKGSQDLSSGVSGNFAWQGAPVTFKAHVYQFSISEQNADLVSRYGRNKAFDGYSLSLQHPYGFDSSTYQGKVALSYLSNRSEREQSQSWRFAHQQSWYMDRGNWGIRQYSNLQWLMGETDYARSLKVDNWNGIQGSVGLSVNVLGIGLEGRYEHAERQDATTDLLQLGGISSGVLSQQAHINWLFSPELPLAFARGNDYSNTSIQLFSRHSNWRLYYAEPKMAQNKLAEIIGVGGEARVEWFRSGITNVKIRYGMAQVNDLTQGEATKDKTLEAWLSLYYQY